MTPRQRPISFTGPMVCALLDGRKTVTRRVLKLPKGFKLSPEQRVEVRDGKVRFSAGRFNAWSRPMPLPYAPGDLLYVRECWRASTGYNDTTPRHLPLTTPIQYEANEPRKNGRSLAGRHRAAMHMPKWASRLTLRVTEVSVERVQEISGRDAMAEGAPIDGNYRDLSHDKSGSPMVRTGPGQWQSPVAWFHTLWDSINAKRGFGWDANPWVCRIAFSVHHKNIRDFVAGGGLS